MITYEYYDIHTVKYHIASSAWFKPAPFSMVGSADSAIELDSSHGKVVWLEVEASKSNVNWFLFSGCSNGLNCPMFFFNCKELY